MKKVSRLIELTVEEKASLYWRFLIGKEMQEQLVQNIAMERMLEKYISKIMEDFGQDFNKVFLSTPEIVKDYEKVRYGGKDFLRRTVCRDFLNPKGTRIERSNEVTLLDLLVSLPLPRQDFSRLFPEKVGPLTLSCGPVGDGNVHERLKTKQTVTANPPEQCYYGRLRSTEVLLEKLIKRLAFGNSPPSCQGALIYSHAGPGSSVENFGNLYYLNSETASIWSTHANATVIFSGSSLYLGGARGPGATGENMNRIYLTSKELMNDCVILPWGTNIIYPDHTENFNCTFLERERAQRNVVVLAKDGSTFSDVRGVDVIMGNEESEDIRVQFAKYIDGGGGGDHITIQKDGPSTVVTANLEDTIVGSQGVVKLPFTLVQISHIIYRAGQATYFSEGWSPIQTDELRTRSNGTQYHPYGKVTIAKNLQVVTADKLFLVPTKVQKGGKVTGLQITRHLDSQGLPLLPPQVDHLRSIPAPNGIYLVRQLLGPNVHVTLADSGNHIFQADKGHTVFFWEGSRDSRHLYVPKREAQFTISHANGIISLENVLDANSTMALSVTDNKGIKLEEPSAHFTMQILPNMSAVKLMLAPDALYDLEMNGLHVVEPFGLKIFVPGSFRKDTLSGFDGLRLRRDYCSHRRVVVQGSMTESAEDMVR